MSKHTPGPWRDIGISPDDPNKCRRIVATNANVAVVINEPEAEANAALIAASPELLAACKEVCEFMARYEYKYKSGHIHHSFDWDDDISQRVLGEAIRKAEGRKNESSN